MDSGRCGAILGVMAGCDCFRLCCLCVLAGDSLLVSGGGVGRARRMVTGSANMCEICVLGFGNADSADGRREEWHLATPNVVDVGPCRVVWARAP